MLDIFAAWVTIFGPPQVHIGCRAARTRTVLWAHFHVERTSPGSAKWAPGWGASRSVLQGWSKPNLITFFHDQIFFVHKNQSIMNYLISQMRKMWRFPALGGTPQSSLRTDPAGVTVITSNSKPRAKHTTAAARGKNLGRENQKGRTFEPFDLSGNIREHTCNHVNDKNMSIYL